MIQFGLTNEYLEGRRAVRYSLSKATGRLNYDSDYPKRDRKGSCKKREREYFELIYSLV